MTRACDIDDVLPWGRNRAEYICMFDLAHQISNGGQRMRILDCGGGPASFTAEMTALGFDVVAADPLYAFSRDEIAARIVEARAVMMPLVRTARERFRWDEFGSPEELEEVRLSAMRHFLEDFEEGREAGRYHPSALPELPFADGEFDLAVSSHFLFLYSQKMDLSIHIKGFRELLRVAKEVRAFPLLDLDGARSAHLDAVFATFTREGFEVEIREVPYEFQVGGNEMLRLARG